MVHLKNDKRYEWIDSGAWSEFYILKNCSNNSEKEAQVEEVQEDWLTICMHFYF